MDSSPWGSGCCFSLMVLSMLVGAVPGRLGAALLRVGCSGAVFSFCLLFFVFYRVKLAALHSDPTLWRAVVEVLYRGRRRCFGFFRQGVIRLGFQVGNRFGVGLCILLDRLWVGTIAVGQLAVCKRGVSGRDVVASSNGVGGGLGGRRAGR